MPATNFTPIQLYRTNTASTTAPAAGNLNAGELAINYNDGGMILFAKNTTGTVIKLMNNPANLLYPTADGTNGQTIRTNGSGTLSFGTLGVAGGGTGLTSGTSGGVPYFSSANTIASSSALAANAIVLGGGAGVAPATTTTGTGVITAIGNNTNSASGLAVLNASGLLNVAQGGTGAASLTANNVILGNGTSAVQFVAPGANGNVLTSNGTTWTSAAAGASLSGQTDSATPFETSLGYQAGNVSTGVNNTFVGYQAGLVTTTGTDNTAVGYAALDANTRGNYNIAVGSNALGANTTGANNTAVGYRSLFANTTGTDNTAIGFRTLDANTSGVTNVAVGSYALYSNTTGQQNTAVGASAMVNNTTGVENTAFGQQALGSNTIGQQSVMIGSNAGYSITTASYNVGVGRTALYNTTTGANNVAVGYNALYANTTGTNNVAVGYQAGDALTTGTGNVIVGYNADASAAGGVDQIVLGNGVTGQANTNVTIGNGTGKIYNAYTVNATWTQTSDGTMKNIIGPDTLGLSFIKRLNPIKFTWKPQNELPKDHPYYNEVNGRDTNAVIHGFVAQEVKAALDAEGCATFNGWDQGSDGIQAISREMFVSPLVKAIQELAAQVEALQARINVLEGN